MKLNKRLFKDFCTFSRLQLKSWDIDPAYPVLQKYYELRNFDEETRLWFTCLYVAYYHLGSAEKTFSELGRSPKVINGQLSGKPTGVERRGFRGDGKVATEHLRDVLTRKPLARWVGGLVGGGWSAVREGYKALRYCGDWSSYKFADLMKWVHCYDITADDLGVGGGGEHAGPIPGMVALTGLDWKECARNVGLQVELYNVCLRQDAAFDGLDQLETCLCDFNSMLKGHYYPGHDIDMMMGQLADVEPDLWHARAEMLPEEVLGEKQGWSGARNELNSYYKRTGEVFDPWRA